MTWKQATSILAVLLVSTGGADAARQNTTPSSGAGVPGRFSVKITSAARVSVIAQSLGGAASIQPISRLEIGSHMAASDEWRRWFTFSTTDTAMTLESVRALIGPEYIEIIEPDYPIEFFGLPTDSLFAYQWYLHNSGQNFPAVYRRPGDFNDSLIQQHGVAGADINLLPVYQSAPAEHTAVVVAIVDTGVDPDHPELQGRFWKNPDEIPGNGIDDDHNGFVDDTLGYDISGDILSINNPQPDNDPTDIVGHGTHIAGIIAAAANQNGVVGVAPHALIMPVKIRPNATTAVGAAGIVYAVNAGARVINISWGTGYRSLLVEDALRIARLNGVFVALAAGNSGGNDRLYPAAGENAFSVAAGNANGLMALFSTFNPQVQLVAPGQDILSLRAAHTDLYAGANEPGVHIIDSQYYLADGTSMAAPMVAGAAALILSYRPDLDLNRLEDVLRFGADDLLDPRSTGASLPGPDTVSGYGYLNVANSVNLIVNGGAYIASPEEQSRLLDSIVVKVAPVSGYSAGWELSWGKGVAPISWNFQGAGSSLPSDSVAAVIRPGDVPSGPITLRLTDIFGTSSFRRLTFVHGRAVELSSPNSDDTVNYFIPIVGSVYGADFDSVVIMYQNGSGAPVRLGGNTAESFDTTIMIWSASGIAAGLYTLRVSGFFTSGRIDREIPIYIRSAFAAGWPQTLAGRGGLTPVCADLDRDGAKEIIVATASGIEVFRSTGARLPGFPAMVHTDVRGIPAVYDVDRDGKDDIIVTAADGIHIMKLNGNEPVGWPRFFSINPTGFGFPTATVTSFGAGSDSVVTFIDNYATIRAYRMNGTPYLFSLGGRYADFSTGSAVASFFNGNSVTAADLNGDSRTEVVATFSSIVPGSGVNIFDGRTAQPAFGLPSASVLTGYGVYGTVLADLSGDKLPEIICVGYDAAGVRTIWVKTMGTVDLSGWPRSFPEIPSWRGNYPMVADLDQDGIPEILVTFFEFDIGVLYIFRADGTPFVTRPGLPEGEAFRTAATLSSPTVGDLTGDSHPEIVLRSGHILPGAGSESVHILTYEGVPVPGWPVATPADPNDVFSTPFAPLVDDIDGDGKAEMALVSEPGVLYVWDFSATHDSTRTFGKILLDNRNGGILRSVKVPTDVGDDEPLLPTSSILHQNYPNPFNPSTVISFEIPAREQVRVDIYNLLGQRVRRIVDGSLPPGRYEVTFDGTGLASGAYLYKIEAGDYRETKKMLLLK